MAAQQHATYSLTYNLIQIMQVKWPYLKIHTQIITSHLTPCKLEKEVHTHDLFVLIQYEFE